MPAAEDLLAAMTLEEKAALLTGDSAWTTLALDRIGLPPLRMADGPHGVRRTHDGVRVGAPEAEKLARSLAASRSDVKVEALLVADETQAVALGFRGSPTVLVDGEDVEPASAIPLGSMA